MNIVKFLSFVCLSLFISVSGAYAHSTIYNSCAVPSVTPTGNVWYINPGAAFVNNDGVSVGAGSTPDAAHGGVAVNGVIGTADGTISHPFNSLKAVFTGGKITPVSGYAWPLLSTAPYDHYGTQVPLGNGTTGNSVGINGQRRDFDWYPTNPISTRINPGDTIILEGGNYGSVGIGYPGIDTNNVDALGNIDFVTIKADTGGAQPVFSTLSVGGAHGFNLPLDGVTITSRLGDATYNEAALVYITGNATTKTSDIILTGAKVQTYADLDAATTDFNLNGASAVNDAAYQKIIGRGGSPLQAYLYDKMRGGVVLAGDDLQNPASVGGVDNHCISVTGLHITYVSTPAQIIRSGNVLFGWNVIDHFGEDAIDFMLSSNISMTHNKISDAMNMFDGNHPDSHQNDVIGTTGPYINVVIDHEQVLERTDPKNPWPNNITFFQNTGNQLSGLKVTYNTALISNCPGIALGSQTINSLVAFNSILGNGVTPGTGCPAPQNGESKGSANNLWIGNLAAGRYYQYCGNGTVWKDNYQISSRSAGVPTRDALGYCKADGTGGITSQDGTYNGVTINGTDSPSFAVNHYDPPASGLTSENDPNLSPTVGGPLYQTGQDATAPNIGGR